MRRESKPRRGRSQWLQRDRIVPKTQQLTTSSRWLHRIDHYASLPMASVMVGIALICAIGAGVVLRFSSGWLTGFETGSAVVTLMMLFVIQHTQGREQVATQRKLDELLRAIPEAESGLMMLEEEPDQVIRDIELDQRDSKESAGTPESGPDAVAVGRGESPI